MSTQASLLCIGTELTSGQTLNSNSQWISQKCHKLGIEIREHSTIPDDHNQIFNELNRLSSHAQLLIVTGGLGPTTDDFTRDVLAKWSQSPLEFYEPSWTKIVARLKERGIEVAESNKQQCYFPKGCTVLQNNEGTADAFYFEFKNVQVLVLPGPPREGQHIWNTHVDGWLKNQFKNLKPEILLKWKCLGKSEASLGEIVESALKGSGFKTGYRASPPYVEVKVWLNKPDDTQSPFIAKLEQAIEQWSVTRNDEDLATFWFQSLNDFLKQNNDYKTLIIDQLADGALTQRLLPLLQKNQNTDTPLEITLMTDWAQQMMKPTPNTLTLLLTHEGNAQMILNGQFKNFKIESPYKSSLMNDRLKKYQVEKALQFWAQQLEQGL